MTKQTTAAFLMVVLGLFQPGLTALRAQGPQEGIKVHGHWAIDVRQPDGTLVTHREFENALLPRGGVLLSQLLGRSAAPGAWSIVFWKSTVNNYQNWSYCSEGNGTVDGMCVALNAAQFLENAAVQVGDNGTLVLSGAVTAAQQVVVAAVSTGVGQCDGSIAPATCTAGLLGFFSGTLLQPNTITVAAGQIIQVTVAISFS